MERKTTQVVAVHSQRIEGVELDPLVMPAGVQSAGIGDAIDTQDDGLAIDHKLLDAVLQGGLGDPRITLRPSHRRVRTRVIDSS
jgi:hypothetical protein